MVNTEKLKRRIKELNKTQSDCATCIGVKTPTFNQKLNNVRPLWLNEAEILQNFLEINKSDFFDYFFCHESSAVQLDTG